MRGRSVAEGKPQGDAKLMTSRVPIRKIQEYVPGHSAEGGMFLMPMRHSVCLLIAGTCAIGWTAPAHAHYIEEAPRRVLQGRGAGGSQNPACAVLTTEEVKTITGFPGYDRPSPGDPPGQGSGGGASCQFSAPAFPTVDPHGKVVAPQKGPLLSIVLIEGKNYTKTVAIGRGCHKEAAAGVGDEAFFEVCPSSGAERTPPLYVQAGNRDLIIQMDVEKPDTVASLRPKVIALAKAAAAKLR